MRLLASLLRAIFSITIYFGLTKGKVACLDQYGKKDCKFYNLYYLRIFMKIKL